MAKKFLTFALVLVFNQILYSQKGGIQGIVKDKTSNETLVGVNVVIEGTTNGTSTDFDGSFYLQDLEPGKYNIQFSFISYNTVVTEDVVVEKNKTTVLNTALDAASIDLNQVTVTVSRRTNTDVSMMSSIKASSMVMTGVSGQQIAKTQDRDASEVVKRIPGISIIDDRFIVVRGLSQRYNTVWLNNAATPSSEADVKAFSFDVIPSAMIDNLGVYKSTAPEFPADFSGGFIKVFTKNMPDKDEVFMSYSSSFSQGTTFKDFQLHQNSKTDWLGYDSKRDILTSLGHLNNYENSDREMLNKIGRTFNNEFQPNHFKATPDQRFSIGIGKKMQIKKMQLGNITSINYSNTMNYNRVFFNNYSIYSFAQDQPSANDELIDDQYKQTAKIGVMHNWAFYPGKGHKIEFRNMFNQFGSSKYTYREGINYYNSQKFTAIEDRYQSRSTLTSQLAGEHSFKDGMRIIDWVGGISYANKKEPDTRRLRVLHESEDTTTSTLIFGASSSPDLAAQSRMNLILIENLYSAGINYTEKISVGQFIPELKIGTYFEKKERTFNARNFGYTRAGNDSEFGFTKIPVDDIFNSLNEVFIDENFNSSTGIKVKETTSRSDSYTAFNELMAGYISAKIPFTSSMNLYTGVRIEKNKQMLNSFKQASTMPVNVERDTVNFFPSANFTYNFTEKMLLRLAYGTSINRPEFREIAPYFFVDFDMNAGIYGNENIKDAYIHNYDIRYEIYPSRSEMISIGGFYKQFINPIEMVIVGDNPMQYTFQNVEAAVNYGVELEIKKSLDFIPSLKDFSLVLNASLINSKVSFDEKSLQRERPMEGQSPYIINAGVFYNNEKHGLNMNLLYNIIGERIIAVGTPKPNQYEDIPNIYEMPRNVLDLTISKRIYKNLEFKGGIKDILNQKIVLKQFIDTWADMPEDGIGSADKDGNIEDKYFNREQIVKSFNPGRYFTVGLSFKF